MIRLKLRMTVVIRAMGLTCALLSALGCDGGKEPASKGKVMKPEQLGIIKLPSGTLLLLDPGYLDLWCHDRPVSPPPPAAGDVGPIVDLAIEGKDAEEAGRGFDRQPHPRFLFDIPRRNMADMEKLFGEFVAKRGYQATLKVLEERVRHRRRIDLGLAQAPGGAAIQFHGLRACALGGLPKDKELPIHGERMAGGPYTDRWRHVFVQVNDMPIDRSEKLGDVFVDFARLMFACADGIGTWVHEEPMDGKADFVFWGLDAEKAAQKAGAPRLSDTDFGWTNLEVTTAAEKGVQVEEIRSRDGLKFATDFRPHSHNYELLKQIRASTTESGIVSLGTSKACGFSTTWGDGIYPVYRDLARDGSLVRLRIDVGNDEIVERQRELDKR